MHFRVKDVFRLGELRNIKDMRFTWDKKRDSPHMIKSRIDRIHARENTIKKGGLSKNLDTFTNNLKLFTYLHKGHASSEIVKIKERF